MHRNRDKKENYAIVSLFMNSFSFKFERYIFLNSNLQRISNESFKDETN